MQENTSRREEEAEGTPVGLELFMDFIMRQYRRGLQVGGAIVMYIDNACLLFDLPFS